MPLYEYECPECGTRIEVLQKLGESGSTLQCQKCAATGLHKLISGCVVPTAGGGKSTCALGGTPEACGFA